MKKESASRRKKLPLLLGALLIISVAAYGTRAYFSDSTKQQANIELQLGNVDIDTIEHPWKNNNIISSEAKKTTEQIDAKEHTTFNNVKPGDSFTRTYTIINKGSLKVNVGLEYSGQYSKTADGVQNTKNLSELNNGLVNVTDLKIDGTPFLITISDLETNFTLKPNFKKDYFVTITVDKNASNETFNDYGQEGLADLDKVASTFLNETLIIHADQIK